MKREMKTFAEIAFDALERNDKKVGNFAPWYKTQIHVTEGARESDFWRELFGPKPKRAGHRSIALDAIDEEFPDDDDVDEETEKASGLQLTIRKIRAFWKEQGITL